MPVKSTIFTALAVCLALSAAEAQARRIAPMPPSSAFQGLWVAEKDAAKLWRLHPDALAVPLRLEIAPGFFEALDAKLAALGSLSSRS
jgi:hypothetical protein